MEILFADLAETLRDSDEEHSMLDIPPKAKSGASTSKALLFLLVLGPTQLAESDASSWCPQPRCFQDHAQAT